MCFPFPAKKAPHCNPGSKGVSAEWQVLHSAKEIADQAVQHQSVRAWQQLLQGSSFKGGQLRHAQEEEASQTAHDSSHLVFASRPATSFCSSARHAARPDSYCSDTKPTTVQYLCTHRHPMPKQACRAVSADHRIVSPCTYNHQVLLLEGRNQLQLPCPVGWCRMSPALIMSCGFISVGVPVWACSESFQEAIRRTLACAY